MLSYEVQSGPFPIARALLLADQIGEVEAKEILRAYDFKILEGKLVESAEAAVETAERLGYPVVMKIVSPDIIHKSDVGGVKLNLATEVYAGGEVASRFEGVYLARLEAR